MLNTRIFVQSLALSAWSLEPGAASALLPVVAGILLGTAPALEKSSIKAERLKHRVYAVNNGNVVNDGEGSSRPSAFNSPNIPSGSVAVIPLKGVMTKEDQNCGPSGTNTKAASLQAAFDNPNITSVVLLADSPGGEVAGLEGFNEVMAGKNKPVVAWVDGGAYSACYWAISGADEIMLSGNNAGVGSIGTMSSIIDQRPALEALGVKFHEVYATDSTDKNKVFTDALAGDYTALKSQILDPLNKTFTGAVKTNRGDKLDLKKENVLTGKTYMGTKAIGAGLADSKGSFGDAVNRASFLSRKQAKSNSTNNNSTSMSNTKGWPKIMALLNITAFAKTITGKFAFTAAQLDGIEAGLNAPALNNAEEVKNLTAQLTAITAQNDHNIQWKKTYKARTKKYKALAEKYGSEDASHEIAMDGQTKEKVEEWRKIHARQMAEANGETVVKTKE